MIRPKIKKFSRIEQNFGDFGEERMVPRGRVSLQKNKCVKVGVGKTPGKL